jgi:Protein of unknown function (DUF2971)
MTISMLLQESMSGDRLADAPKHVWHYSDAEGAAGIIDRQELWATDGLFMNDLSELQLVHELFNTVFRVKDFRGRVADVDEWAALRAAFDGTVESFQTDPGVYAVCFCQQGDLLSQWRSYGRHGGGYSLGFSSAALAALDQAVVGTLDFFKVMYDRDDQHVAIFRFCDTATQFLERYLESCSAEERLLAIEETGTRLGTMAQWFAARVKDSAFQEEQEWRLIYRMPSTADKEVAYDRQFRATGRGLLPYVKLPLAEIRGKSDDPGPFPLERVRMGPTANSELAGRAMNYLLKDRGFDIQVEPSLIPLRD